MKRALPATAFAGALRASACVLFAAAMIAFHAAAARGKDAIPYVVGVEDVSAKVGEHVEMVATLKLKEGYSVLDVYNNRVWQLSSLDDGVAFDREVFRGDIHDDTLTFTIGLHATKAGKHPINGVFRFGYVDWPSDVRMISVPLIANVIGTD